MVLDRRQARRRIERHRDAAGEQHAVKAEQVFAAVGSMIATVRPGVTPASARRAA